MKNKTFFVILFCIVLLLLFSQPTAVSARFPVEDLSPKSVITEACPPIQNTPFFTIVYGSVTLNGSDAPIGALVKAYSPRSDLVGCFAVTTAGSYGAMYIYGEDTSVVPSIPGMRNNEPVSFTINGLPATPASIVLWKNDKDLHAIDLASMGASANFSATPISGVSPLVVQFTDTSSGSITSRLWEFGDGQTSTDVNPQHTYTTTGSYTVSLTVNGPAGSDVETKTNYISVYSAVVSNFSADKTNGIAPLLVSFTNGSTGSYSNLSWNFGDGGTSTATNPTHIYTTGGVFTVSLTASGPGGTDTETKTNYITVYNPVVAGFASTPASGVEPLTVNFTNTSSGSYTNLSWDFGDGGTSTAINPSHVFTSDGTYTVVLTASGPGGTSQATAAINVYLPASASFNASPTSGIAPINVTFTNTSTGDFSSSFWDFGDGNTSSEINPVHSYSTSGIFTVSLTVTGLGGTDMEVKTSQITVFSPTQAQFSGAPTSGVVPLSVSFVNQSSGDFTSLTWTFGDGTSSVESNPIHEYLTSGIYTVSLSIDGPGGPDLETKTNYITVFDPVNAEFSATPTTGIGPLEVTFTNLSSGSLDGFTWDFGDGNTSNEANPVHIYANKGLYTVTLTASGPGGVDQEIRSDYITVYQPVMADFFTEDTAGATPHTAQFTNLSTGDYDTFTWDFGDGATSSDINPSHVYTTAGTYTVSLTASGDGGTDVEIKTAYITVYNDVSANFSSDVTSGVAPLTVQFTDLSTGDYNTLAWDFGDGATSSDINPSHVYTTAGTYTVSLTASGDGGTDVEIKTAYITVYNDVSANFSSDVTSGVAPLTVQFTDLSTGDYNTLAWDFGDGSTNSEVNPSHVYTTAGTYTVSLTASGDGGTDVETKTAYITVYTAVSADFSADVTSGVAPLTVQFTDLSTGDYDTLAWDFGDGSTSAEANPAHVYSAAGTYTVSLTASGDGGTDVETKTAYITVYTPIVAEFTYTPASGIAPMEVQFTNASTGDYDSLVWDFGDGGSNTESNPTHTFAVGGTYTVTLTATGLGGEDVQTHTIEVFSAVSADFSADVTSGIAPLSVQFTDLSTGDYDTLAWDFGDGGSSLESNPSHVYTIAGTYTVSLTASGDGGTDVDTKTAYITVYTAVSADFSADVTSGVAPFTVQFTDLSTGDYDTWQWDFGDGGTSAEANPIHIYTNAGVYSVTLTVTGNGGEDTRMNQDLITVIAPIVASFTADKEFGIAPLSVSFTDTSTGDPSSWSWDFGDGNVSSEQNPIHVFVYSGDYNVVLTVTGPGGTDTAELIIHVNPFNLYLPLILK